MKYDVAFSLVSDDQELAEEIQKRLPSDITSFLYSTAQRELIISQDGLNAFPKVFQEASICVVLNRESWGLTAWTRLEERAIAERFMETGSGFLLFLQMETALSVPNWFPTTRIWVDYLEEGPNATAEIIAERLKYIADPRHAHETRRNFGRRPIPISRYQRQRLRIMEHLEVANPTTCDVCTMSIEFRPMVRVSFPSVDGYPACSEYLCPRCARERDIRMTPPPGMNEEEMYLASNPSFPKYVNRLLGFPVLQTLSNNPEIKALGVTNVGAIGGGRQFEVRVSLSDQSISIPFEYHQLEKLDIRSAPDFIEHFKSTITDRLTNAV